MSAGGNVLEERPFLRPAGQVCVGAAEKLMLMAASSMPPSARRCFPSKNPAVCSSEDLEGLGKTCNNCLWVLFCTCQSVTWMVPALGGGYSCDLNLLDFSCGHAERRENPISILRNLCHHRVMGGLLQIFLILHFDLQRTTLNLCGQFFQTYLVVLSCNIKTVELLLLCRWSVAGTSQSSSRPPI